MSTYGSGIRIQAAVSGSGFVTSLSPTTATLYTCPAGSYAIVHLGINSGGICRITIDGKNVVGEDTTRMESKPFYIGPGQAVVMHYTIASSTVDISGVEFKNGG